LIVAFLVVVPKIGCRPHSCVCGVPPPQRGAYSVWCVAPNRLILLKRDCIIGHWPKCVELSGALWHSLHSLSFLVLEGLPLRVYSALWMIYMFEVGGFIRRRDEFRGVSVCYYFPVRGWLPDGIHSLVPLSWSSGWGASIF
jgi:hypothetical protein